MILTCPNCATRYEADAAKFLPAGRKVRCAKCGHTWHQPAPAPEEANSQDDIDALFDMSPEELNKTNSQDDIDALFD